jgi:CRISPR-associated endoribonuclease Cas6
LRAKEETFVPLIMGRLVHVLFFNLMNQFDPGLSTQLHNQPGYRPFTLSLLSDVSRQGQSFKLRREQPYYLRVTLLDGGNLWHRLSTHFLESGPVLVQLGPANLQLTRMLSTPAADPTGWAGSTDWQTLINTPAVRLITIQFFSPTAFNMGNREFELFPKPPLVWESLLRVWNTYAPDHLKLEKQGIRAFLMKRVAVTNCNLSTDILYYPQYVQKGFVGTCTYVVLEESPCASHLATLAAFARFAGVGHKTTMGMGQARAEFDA